MTSLRALLAITETGEFEDNGRIDIASAHWQPSSLMLKLDVDHGDDAFSSWSVHCLDVLEYHLSNVFECGLNLWERSHPVLDQYVQPREHLNFSFAATEPSRVVGELWLAHRAVSDDWIPFDRYVNTEIPLNVLLGSSSGELATGPSFLIEAYEQVLDRNGCRPSRAAATERQTDKASFIHFGESYVVARTFNAERIAG